MAEERWFVAIIVVQAHLKEEKPPGLLTYTQHRLIQAADAEEAYAKALGHGQWESQSWQLATGRDVDWEVVGLNDLCELSEGRPADGTEIYSCFVDKDAKSLVLPKAQLAAFAEEPH